MTCSQSVSVNMSQFSQSIITCSLMSVLSGNSTSQVESATTTASAELHRWRPGTGSPAWALHTKRIPEFLINFIWCTTPHAVAGYGSKVPKLKRHTFWPAMGGKGRYGGKGSKGKQVNTSTKGGAALALPNHYTVDILRPYHSEDGSVFVKRAGASRDGDLLSPEGLAQRVNATNSEQKRPEPSGSARGSAAGRKAPSRGAAYSDKCRTDLGSGALSSRVPVRSGLRRYVAQDHDPWCPFVRDGATSAAGAWDQIIPQQMDPNASWEVLFLWKDF